jgi:hypothetical protein
MVLEASQDWELSLVLSNNREDMDLTPIITEWRN